MRMKWLVSSLFDINGKDMIGKMKNGVQVISFSGRSHGHLTWNCICYCGKSFEMTGKALRLNQNPCCGCNKGNKTHGESKTRLYQIWYAMKERCHNKNDKDYHYYGDVGIKVCNEWLYSFETFMKWAKSKGYNDELTIDRVDNSLGYQPINCRFATITQQNRNRSNSIYLNYNGESKTLIEWCQKFGMTYRLAYSRYSKGWSFEDIFFKPKRGVPT